MPKKDTAAAVVGMLSSAGAQTRRLADPEPPNDPAPTQLAPAETAPPEQAVSAPAETAPPEQGASASAETVPAQASVSELRSAERAPTGEKAPRTLRLRADTAERLRAAWLEAKRDDVLLTAQDFASSLVEDALRRHQRRRAANS